jgi:PAS domain S-box-containing protein
MESFKPRQMQKIHKKNKDSTESASLRQKAEELLHEKLATQQPLNYEGDIQKMLHELEVHQIELEIQNEELRIALENEALATNKYTTLYDFAPAGYFTLDRDGNITNLNLNGAKMLGMERGRLINAKLKHFINRDDKDAFQAFHNSIFKGEIKQTCELQLENWVNQSCFVFLEGIKSDDNNTCFVTAIDITLRHKAEEALKESETRLKVLNATKDKFFSIIAHDLRNPFTSIIGFSSLLMSQSDNKSNEVVIKYSKIIYESSLRAMDLLKNLMEWANLQTGKISFNPKQLEFTNIITTVIELLTDLAGQKSITIVRDTDPGITTFADEEMINTVLRNLVSNAIKFTKPGGEITISARVNSDELIVSVGDNGVGMDKKQLNKLFRIEENSSTKGTQNEEGTGLGLVLCKEFILRHQGKIWVESTLGAGSKFFFTIPQEKNQC